MSEAVFATYLAFPAGVGGTIAALIGLYRPSRLAPWNAFFGALNLAFALQHMRWEWLF